MLSSHTGSSRSESDLGVHIRKATNPDETAPKRKHVRACIVYTWDHRSGRAFWNGMKVQPLEQDEVQLFKALITIHKVLQEGHGKVLQEAQAHINWIQHFQRSGGRGSGGYTRLITEYVRFLTKKLDFHREHPEFNGTFEYEEYISLRTVNDPNEGFNVILDLMSLQDAIDDFQRLVFATIKHGRQNECKISSLTAMVTESYNIYKFLTSMLRAMHEATDDHEALEPLRARYASQHRRLADFYYDCSSLKYLTSLITIPVLSDDPPNLFGDDNGPALPRRPQTPAVAVVSDANPSQSSLSVDRIPEPEPLSDWWGEEQRRQEQEQQRLEQEQQMLEEERQRQQMLLEQQMREQQMEQQRMMEQNRMMQEQMTNAMHASATQELQRDLLQLRAAFEQSQQLLEQYDQRVKALESELAQSNQNVEQQLQSKDGLIQSLQDQVNMWKQKYENLAKLYGQLRQEHIDLMAKYKKVEARAASAQEAIDKKERCERDLKSKNLELADLIKERDRARYEIDRIKGSHRHEIETLERDMRLLQDKLDNSERGKGADMSLLISRHTRELADLEEALKAKQRIIDQQQSRGLDDETLQQKDEEIAILQEQLSSLDQEISKLSLSNGGSGPAADVGSILDAVMTACTVRVQDAMFAFESPMEAGNQNATPQFLLSVLEKTSAASTDFTMSFIEYTTLAGELENQSPAEVIKHGTSLANELADMLGNTKGLCRLANEEETDSLETEALTSARKGLEFFSALYQEFLADLETDDVSELLIGFNGELQQALQALTELVEKMLPHASTLTRGDKDLGSTVDNEMSKVSHAVEDAVQRLTALLGRRNPKFSAFDVQVSDLILTLAIAVTTAIAALIKAAIECQAEIVANGRGDESRTEYYKRHNRWTEGLISAARAVGGATSILIETADGCLSGSSSPEQLIVSVNEVAASTAQLVAASRVRANFMSERQDRLEQASKSVTNACKSLVNRVQSILAGRNASEEKRVDYESLPDHEFKRAAMTQQVEVLRLEQALTAARNKLFDIRKVEYKREEEEEANQM